LVYVFVFAPNPAKHYINAPRKNNEGIMKRAVVFPGQGSQQVGMGKALHSAFLPARLVFEEVDEALKQRLSSIIFEGSEEALTLTENAQPAIMATSIAILRVLEKETGFVLSSYASYVAGHSLGEYTALCAAGTFSLADTARLLKLRGQAMQKAVPSGEGAMAAILGLEEDAVVAIVAEASALGVCAIANDNSPGQIVISGAVAAIEKASALAKDKGAKRALLLPVSAPFHCPLMKPAAQAMEAALATTTMSAPSVPLVANVTASAVRDPATIRNLLVEQVTGRVRWRESVMYLGAQGVTSVLELGTGKVLSGLIKRTVKDLEAHCIAEPQDIESFVKMA
jgi:[acyl-carrier-protein] S-malonyltransferase